jgi:hypothetical protein
MGLSMTCKITSYVFPTAPVPRWTKPEGQAVLLARSLARLLARERSESTARKNGGRKDKREGGGSGRRGVAAG